MSQRVIIELGSYRIVAERQLDEKVWLISEYSEPNQRPINIYAISNKKLPKHISKILNQEIRNYS